MNMPTTMGTRMGFGLALWCGGWAAIAQAQDLFPGTRPEEDLIELAPATPGTQVTSQRAQHAPFVYGPWQFRPFAAYRMDYGDGILSSAGTDEKTHLHRVTLGTALDFRDRWSADYEAAWNFYSSDAFSDTVSHRAGLTGAAYYQAWQFAFSQRFSKTDSPLIETGRQTGLETHATSFTVARSITDRMSGSVELRQDLRYADTFSDVFEWSIAPRLSYVFASDLTGWVSAGVGHEVVTSAPDTLYFRPQVGLSAQVSRKIAVTGYLGVDHREFLAGLAEDMDTPMYGGQIAYQALEHTSVIVDIGQSTSTSLVGGAINESQHWGVRLDQRLFGRLSLSVSYRESESEFISPTVALPISRTDDRNAFQASLGTDIFQRGHISVSYRKTENQSSRSEFAVDSSVVGFQLDYRY